MPNLVLVPQSEVLCVLAAPLIENGVIGGFGGEIQSRECLFVASDRIMCGVEKSIR